LTKEGLTAKEIAQRLGRSPAAIRNLRYKKHLVTRAEDETKALFQQRDELINMVRSLEGQKTTLACEVAGLKKEKEKLVRKDESFVRKVVSKNSARINRKIDEITSLLGSTRTKG
jgi:uncharacterized protein YdcH (DUF465 family)